MWCGVHPLCSTVSSYEKQNARRLKELKAAMQREMVAWTDTSEKLNAAMAAHRSAVEKVRRRRCCWCGTMLAGLG